MWLSTTVEVRLGQHLEAELVERVRGVRHQLAKEHIAIGIERVNHEVEQLLDLGLKLETFGGLAHT